MYRRLYSVYGPQGWWPTTPASSVAPTYRPGRTPARLSESERFEICLGAFLTQNTNWSNVEKVLALLSRRRLLKARSLERLPLARLARLFRSSGYFRQKAARVRAFLRHLRAHYQGRVDRLLGGDLGAARARLLALNGVGPETADSMLLYAGGRPVFVVDAYTRRIGQRWGILSGSESYDEVQSIFSAAFPGSVEAYGEFHALLVKLAKEHCRTVPRCAGCPAQDGCRHGSKGGKR